MASMQQSFKSGQSQGHAQAKSEEWMESGKEAANKESAHEPKQEASGFLQQTGEQMMNMAQGAVDTVKNTLGIMNDNNNDTKKN